MLQFTLVSSKIGRCGPLAEIPGSQSGTVFSILSEIGGTNLGVPAEKSQNLGVPGYPQPPKFGGTNQKSPKFGGTNLGVPEKKSQNLGGTLVPPTPPPNWGGGETSTLVREGAQHPILLLTRVKIMISRILTECPFPSKCNIFQTYNFLIQIRKNPGILLIKRSDLTKRITVDPVFFRLYVFFSKNTFRENNTLLFSGSYPKIKDCFWFCTEKNQIVRLWRAKMKGNT